MLICFRNHVLVDRSLAYTCWHFAAVAKASGGILKSYINLIHCYTTTSTKSLISGWKHLKFSPLQESGLTYRVNYIG